MTSKATTYSASVNSTPLCPTPRWCPSRPWVKVSANCWPSAPWPTSWATPCSTPPAGLSRAVRAPGCSMTSNRRCNAPTAPRRRTANIYPSHYLRSQRRKNTSPNCAPTSSWAPCWCLANASSPPSKSLRPSTTSPSIAILQPIPTTPALRIKANGDLGVLEMDRFEKALATSSLPPMTYRTCLASCA